MTHSLTFICHLNLNRIEKEGFEWLGLKRTYNVYNIFNETYKYNSEKGSFLKTSSDKIL